MLRLDDDGSVASRWVEVETGATVRDAIDAAGGSFDPDHLAMFGQSIDAQRVLTEGDRVEVLRPLVIDPKMARRERAHDQTQSSRDGN